MGQRTCDPMKFVLRFILLSALALAFWNITVIGSDCLNAYSGIEDPEAAIRAARDALYDA
jgi:hypothetical protein